MKPSAVSECGIVMFPAAQNNAGSDQQNGKGRFGNLPDSLGSGPVLFLNMTGGDLYIRGDGRSCLYVRKRRDDPPAVY